MKSIRILALALSLALSVSLLGGCQKSGNASGSVSSSSPDASAPVLSSDVNVSFLSGPTGVGAAKMMEDRR